MTENELRKLSRAELLEMLLKLSTENQQLNEKLEIAEAELHNRQIKIDTAGSIAEASLQLNGVFEAAQAACRQYTENIESLCQRQEVICSRLEEESRAKANALLLAAKKQQIAMMHDTEVQCAEMTRQAKAQSEAYWNEVFGKLEKFYAEHVELRDLLGIMTQRRTKEQEERI